MEKKLVIFRIWIYNKKFNIVINTIYKNYFKDRLKFIEQTKIYYKLYINLNFKLFEFFYLCFALYLYEFLLLNVFLKVFTYILLLNIDPIIDECYWNFVGFYSFQFHYFDYYLQFCIKCSLFLFQKKKLGFYNLKLRFFFWEI